MKDMNKNSPYDELVNFDDQPREIKENDRERLLEELEKFNKWLIDEKVTESLFDIKDVTIEPTSKGDWIMKVHNHNGAQKVSFNPVNLNAWGYDFFEVVILHEYFHLVVQKVPNKDDAVKIKDYFGSDFMSLIDIEADFYVALYLKDIKGYNIDSYWELNFKGSTAFSDDWIRAKKFERFLGSLLSVNKMFLSPTKIFDLYLPSISPVYTEDHMKILVLKREHIYFEEINASYQDFIDIKKIYKQPSEHSVTGYIKTIKKFTAKALNTSIEY
ncbi:hypothetical protein OA93_12310 [Flavobacterium sp. KMS]|uniref:hypothetical protein n=1 Tax=Flavobacterium sp. KMS TaxID=1566023 RepID=UPI00057CE4AC|nr:hypothetical protein [Flavobacterium sp. KMS]KIA97764.1 hypothetical protein OA93_12310 [Flavobacterium sp. KMS]